MPSVADLIFRSKRVEIQELDEVTGLPATGGKSVILDVSEQEDHTSENEVTDYPVEQGANIADNSRPKPLNLNIRGRVTGTPLDITAIAQNPFTKSQRGKQAFEQLQKWRFTGKRLAVRTTLLYYLGVVIQSISVPRNAKNTDGVDLQIHFQQIFTAQSQIANSPKRAKNPPKTTVGSKATAPASSSVVTSGQGSTLFSLFGQ